MSRKRKCLRLLCATLLFTCLFATAAYASDAVVDILDGERFTGAVQWVNKIGQFVDQFFVAFISFISFFIISASCLRNVLAGAYCVFPKFWDKVDEAHKAMQSISVSDVMNLKNSWQTSVSTGSITQFLLRLLPNIKVLTDFEDVQDIDYKQYFMKAIPQCVLAVFVGVFIYNGYYRDVMMVTSRFGSEVVNNAISSVKPEEIMYKLTNISGIPSYPVKGAEDGPDMIADTLVKAAYGHVLSEYEDQNEKANKSDCFNKLSGWASNYVESNFADFHDTDIWSVKVLEDNVQIGNEPNNPKAVWSKDAMTYTCYVNMNVSDLGLKSEYHKTDTVYVWMKVQFHNEGSGKSSSVVEVSDFVLHLPQYRDNVCSFGDVEGNYRLKSNNDATIGNTAIRIDRDSITFKKTFDHTTNEMYQATNLSYASTSANYKIIGVVFEDNITAYLTSSSTGLRITMGDSVEDAYNEIKYSKTGTTSGSDEDEDVDDSEDSDYVDSLNDGAD